MPSVQPEEEIIAGDEWIRYQEFEVMDDDLILRIDKYLHKTFSRRYDSGGNFVVLPKMVKCVITSFRTKKRMLTKQNMALNEDTIIGFRASKAAVEEFGGVNKVPITHDLLEVPTNSHKLYTEHLIEENAKTERSWKVKAGSIHKKTWWNENWREKPAWKARTIKDWINSSTEGYGESYELCWRRGTENQWWT